ncbi:MAG TPA: helix-hairpin-helix domain-containing protein [Gemmatimonadales bacterium]|nr:helix-hairpin-helix domain-containing protein [Gemmatimonadales bacterium]
MPRPRSLTARLSAEHRAVLILLGLAAAGHGARYLLSSHELAPGAIRLLGEEESPTAHRDSLLALARPLAPGERVDLDRAGVREIERLPGIGPGLARRIVADREANGPFGGPEGLDRVPGVGEAVLTRIGPWAAFGGAGRGGGAGAAGTAGAAVTAEGRPSRNGPSRPEAFPVISAVSVAPAASAAFLNSASEADLRGLPGIGPAKARAIVAYREAHGPFASFQGLLEVPGIGPALMAKVAAALEVP